MQPKPPTPEQLCEMNLAPPEQWDLRIAEVAAPLTAAMQQMAFDLAKVRAEVRAWQEHAARQAEQIAALKAARVPAPKNGLVALPEKVKA